MMMMAINPVIIIIIIVKVLTTTLCMRVKPRCTNCGISLTKG